jgi:hypothetical protein
MNQDRAGKQRQINKIGNPRLPRQSGTFRSRVTRTDVHGRHSGVSGRVPERARPEFNRDDEKCYATPADRYDYGATSAFPAEAALALRVGDLRAVACPAGLFVWRRIGGHRWNAYRSGNA